MEDRKFPIVGIGASAGGIAAMEGLFQGLPPDCGMAFVVITHLSPERESVLHEVIARYTAMTVQVAQDKCRVRPCVVYVLPRSATLTIQDGVLQLREIPLDVRERKPVDIFFSALAQDQGEYAVGVVLSGGDSDGTLGVKAIKEHGGLTLAQVADGSEPGNPEMPQSAIHSGLIDLALPAEKMGERLVEFAHSFELLDELIDESDSEGPQPSLSAQQEIARILRGVSGHDFSGYKTRTFMRRVRRRMQIQKCASLEAYMEQLRDNPDELQALFRDLLINVTNFFRDTDAFETLERRVIPELFKDKTSSDVVRIWVPGCATGEEVFSLAILMREHMDTLRVPPRVQLFATDIDDEALGVARAARYPAALMGEISAERRKRFFTTDGASFVLNRNVRDLCIFSAHSVIRDPPFSRMDMVSCRNLLIYFGADIQKQVIPTFHYSLKPGGFLFLGTSESVSHHPELFAPIDKKNRIFRARELGAPPRIPALFNATLTGQIAPRGEGAANRSASHSMRQIVETQVLERFAPAHVVVNAEGDVVYYSAKTGKYLEVPQGAPSRQLLTMTHGGLRLELRSALRDAIEKQQTVVRDAVNIDTSDDVQAVRLTVERVVSRSASEPLYLVLFESIEATPTQLVAASPQVSPADAMVKLERELRDTRERLQSTIEEYETALEELKASNEELVSVNEESQSTNEELEASKEEMQSLNEELNTINAELVAKVEDLDRANSDLKSLFESAQIATVFLDTRLVIRSFTPAASAFFNLLKSDVGRPLTDLAIQLHYPHLREHIAQVFASGEAIEHQLDRNAGGVYHLVRIFPYRDGISHIRGVVVTFVDVTSLAEAEGHQRVLISELNHRVKNMLAVTISIANQTLKKAKSPEAFANGLIGRLHAMARAYGALSRENWKDASVAEIVGQELEPFELSRIVLHGADVRLKPQQGLSLGMVVHELATNAAKYGALSTSSGIVTIGWVLEDKNTFSLLWTERDGPAVVAPERNGFGLTLVRGEIEYRLGGRMSAEFGSDGLRLELSFPLIDEEKELE